jgi:hypothetical protein
MEQPKFGSVAYLENHLKEDLRSHHREVGYEMIEDHHFDKDEVRKKKVSPYLAMQVDILEGHHVDVDEIQVLNGIVENLDHHASRIANRGNDL